MTTHFSFLLKGYKTNAFQHSRLRFPRLVALAIKFSRASQQATRPPTLGGRSHAGHMITSLVSQNFTSSRLCDFPPFVANGNDLQNDAVSISYSCCRLLGDRKRRKKKSRKSLQRKDESDTQKSRTPNITI